MKSKKAQERTLNLTDQQNTKSVKYECNLTMDIFQIWNNL